ncbi:MAG: hypothetical protein K0R81_3100 [Microbacterium sp.]|nr:hypothetical protein [Microbacterium sp.]
MTEFLEWDGWNALGAIASVLALATFGVGLFQVVRRQRQIKPVVIGWDIVGTVKGPRRKDKLYVLEIRNSGAGVAFIRQLTLVHARGVTNVAHRPKKTLGRGESFTLLIRSDDLWKAWFRLEWREEQDRRLYRIRWYPLLWSTHGGPGSSLAEKQEAHRDRRRLGLWWTRVRTYWAPRPVDPEWSFSGTYKDRPRRVWPLPDQRKRGQILRKIEAENVWEAYDPIRLDRLPDLTV